MRAKAAAETESIDLAAIEARLQKKSTKELWSHFEECLGSAAVFLADAAVTLKILEDRGEDLSDVAMIGTFRRIAAGQVDPRLVWKFMASPARHIVEQLPLPDQRRLVANPMVPVVEKTPDGKLTSRMWDFATAPRRVVEQVVSPDGILNEDQQRLNAVRKEAATRIVAKSAKQEDSEILEPLRHQVTAKLTDSEYQALKMHAALNKCSERELVRRGLLMSGYLKLPRASRKRRSG